MTTANTFLSALLSLVIAGGGLAGTETSSAEADAPAPVRSVRVAADGDQTVIGVRVGPEAEARHFLLSDPLRLVVDLENARHGLSRSQYSVGRGGVVRLRSSQFRDGVVRLVFELTRRPEVSVRRSGGELQLRFDNPASAFEPWSTGPAGGSATGAEAAGASAGGNGGSAELREGAAPSETSARNVEGIEVAGADRAQEKRVPRITVSYDQAVMQDVLSGFSEFAGISIVPSNEAANVEVQGVTITDQPWDQALDAILSSHGLGWERLESGIIIVDRLSALRGRDTLQTETRVFRINYAGADSVATALQNLTGDNAQVVPYGGTNSVIVTAPPPTLARMDSLVNVVDQRTAQVAIEAKIIFVDRTNVNALGITYDLKDQSDATGFNTPVPMGGVPVEGQAPQTQAPFAVDLGGSAIAGVANANDRVASPALQILANTVFGGFSLTTFIDALQSQQLSDIQATPSIKVVDNNEARIQVGQRTPIRVLEPSAQLQQAQVNVQFEETGIILEVTPHVTNNNQVLLDLHAERSGIAEAPSDLGFAFDTQEGDTRLLLDNGETGVIGGLTLSDVSRSETGIPLLMDLPLIGGLFRTTRQTERKQDLIILVTPRIVSPQGGETPMTGGAPGTGG